MVRKPASYFTFVIMAVAILIGSTIIPVIYAQNESFPFNPEPNAPEPIKHVINKILSLVQYLVTAVALLYVFLNVYYFTRGEAAPDVKRNIFIGIIVIVLVWLLPTIIQWVIS